MLQIAWLFVCAAPAALPAQEVTLFDHPIQVHGFASQGFIYTDENNWLTTHSSQGSGAFTDFGFNVSTPINDKLRVGAQLYDRNLGNLGEWHPSLDWAVADYRFTTWFGIRGGKIKTKRGLYNDTQDLDFLQTFALLPQSIYPTDLRDSTIAHLGVDLYGTIPLRSRGGDLSYTAYAGHRSDSVYSGYPYLLTQFDIHLKRLGGLQYGGDLRWNTPLKGLLLGASRMNEYISGTGTSFNYFTPAGGIIPYSEHSRADWTNQYYGLYTRNKLQIASEYRRYFHDQMIFGGISEDLIDVRGWYVSGTYRAVKRLQLGSYYSHYTVGSLAKGFFATTAPPGPASLPGNHVYDKVISARIDLNRYWDVKIEGHFINGYGNAPYPEGFYPQVNPNGFKPDTNALVIRTGVNF
jgi:hypothetical protein